MKRLGFLAGTAVAALVLLLVLLEIFLRVAGGFMDQPTMEGKPPARKGQRVVLAVGDSHTLGYANLVLGIVEQKDPGGWHMIIGAKPGLNSAQILEHLRLQLPRLRPDMVFVLTAGTNHWNLAGYHAQAASQSKGGAKSWLGEAMAGVKLVRLYRGIMAERARRAEGGHAEGAPDTRFFSQMQPAAQALDSDGGSPDEVMPGTTINRMHVTEELLTTLLEAERLSAEGDHKGSREKYELMLASRDKFLSREFFIEITVEVGWGLAGEGKKDAATRWFINAVDKYPDHSGPPEALLNFLLQTGGGKKVQPIFEKLAAKQPRLRRYIETARRRQALSDDQWSRAADKWRQDDLRRIVALCRKYGARTVLISYPHDRKLASLIRSVAQETKTPFVDSHALLVSAMRNGTEKEALFLPDGHCTPAGYEVMATHLTTRFLLDADQQDK